MSSSATTGHVVVVGVDGTEDGQRALRYGLGEARRRGHTLRLVHAWSDPGPAAPRMPRVPDPASREAAAEVLFAAEREAVSWGFRPADLATALVRGPRVAAVIENLADASCVVLGTRATGGDGMHGGSTTTGVAARSKVPVHCVPASWDPARAERRCVVAGVDGSEATSEVVAGALEEARVHGAQLEVVHAWWPTDQYDPSSLGGELGTEWEEVARAALTRTVEAVAGPAPDVRWTLKLYFQRPVAALRESSLGADLLLIGRRGHRWPLGFGLGSTSRAMLRTAACPVVVVPVRRRADRALDEPVSAASASA